MSLVVDHNVIEWDRVHDTTNHTDVAFNLCGCALDAHQHTLVAPSCRSISQNEHLFAIWTHNPLRHFEIPRLTKAQFYSYALPCAGRREEDGMACFLEYTKLFERATICYALCLAKQALACGNRCVDTSLQRLICVRSASVDHNICTAGRTPLAIW